MEKEEYNFINIGGLSGTILILGLFGLAYLMDYNNKEYCVENAGHIVIYDRDVIFDDWTCDY